MLIREVQTLNPEIQHPEGWIPEKMNAEGRYLETQYSTPRGSRHSGRLKPGCPDDWRWESWSQE